MEEEKMITRFMKACAAFVLTIGLGNVALADQHEGCDPDPEKLEQVGTVKGEMNSVGFLAGVRWGDGVLTLKDGAERNFKVLGLKVLETGVAANDFEGEVYNLKATEDFEGTYYGATARISVIGSTGEGVVNNAKCVVVKLRYSGGGVQISAPAPGGVEVSFTE
jgi:hypothetical protein